MAALFRARIAWCFFGTTSADCVVGTIDLGCDDARLFQAQVLLEMDRELSVPEKVE